ncbi:hypothetical protein L9F63_003328 [Diploptera punctata]|uniref:ABC transporter domain-containing protein n=1 Tax=Diploptera punctata TaxID=6984 RepID=A0AAD7ZLY7_DIPPU|nr:hypothetical protein L9F63_003328 [Diploptera punctata]
MNCTATLTASVTRQMETSPLLRHQEYDLTLSWDNITVQVKQQPDSTQRCLNNFFSCAKKQPITILDRVSGRVQSGNVVAVLGSSGSGKTSLLATVSARIKGHVSGDVKLCGQPVAGSLLRKISGFVPQQDVAVETLTAREHLQFMACMRLDRAVSRETRNKWISALLVDLNLAGCANTRIMALSGGERRRLSLAVELLTDPPLLFCDEPTTGLDSYNASTVVEKLHQLAARGKAILCSIHQPASDVLTYFHKMMFMAGGRVAFHGTLQEAHAFFSSQQLVCPPLYNPAEFYIQQLSVLPGEEEASQQRIAALCDAYQGVQQQDDVEFSVPHIQAARNSCTEISQDFQKYSTIRGPYWHTQVYWLLWRSLVDSKRNKSGHAVQACVFLVTSVMLSLCFMSSEARTQSWVQDIRGLLYLITSEVYFTSAYSVFYTFPREIPVYLRESGLYSASAYYFSKMLSLIPRAVVEPVLYLAIIFVIVDFADESLLMFMLLAGPIIVISNSATAYGCMLSALFESADLAAVVAVPVDLISLIMAGIFYNVRVLPVSLVWVKYLSQFYYANEALAVVHWSSVDYIKCANNTNLPCMETGTQVLDEYGFKTENLAMDFIVLTAFFISLHFIGFLGVLRRSKKKAAY